MTNADKFTEVFGIYATELWVMSEKDFLIWLNKEVNKPEPTGVRHITGKRYTATVNLETMELVIDRDDEHGNLTKEDLMQMGYIRTDEKKGGAE